MKKKHHPVFWIALAAPLLVAIAWLALKGNDPNPLSKAASDLAGKEMNLLFEEGLVFDNDGKFIYQFPGVYPRFTEDGGVVMGIASPVEGAGYVQSIVKIGKRGNLSLKSPEPTHHDLTVDDDGNIYLLQYKRVNQGDKILRTGQIVKIGPAGKVLRRWDFRDHQQKIGALLNRRFDLKIVEKITDAEEVIGRKVGCGGRCLEAEHFNSLQALPANSVAEKIPAFARGNILTSFPLEEHIAILDRDSFEIIWSMKLDRVIFFHTPNLTSDGHIMVFVNSVVDEKGQNAKKSSLLEIDPVTRKTVWSYTLPPELYSPFNGSVIKLPNGNYLFTVVTGIAREITPEGKTVWEWKKKGPFPAGELYRVYRLNEKEKKAVIGFIERGV